MAEITNKAFLNYNSGSTTHSTESNTARVTLQGPMTIAKYALEENYRFEEELTYNILITNTSSAPLNGVVVVDDLGTYEFTTGISITPLTYLGVAKILQGTAFQPVLGTVATDKRSVTFQIGTIPALTSVVLQYNVSVNEFAGPSILNTAEVTATGIASAVTATHELPVDSYAQVEIEKIMSPDPIVDGGVLSYQFILTNYGNLDATSIVLSDAFHPAPDITVVKLNQVDTTNYTYSGGIFTLPDPTQPNTVTVPKATFQTDPDTGATSVIPGTTTILVQGKL